MMLPRVRRYCRFKGCKNNDKTEREIHFHRFPLNKTRCEAWVKAAQNEKLYGLSPTKLNSISYVCSDHFQDWCFMNIKSKARLVHNAIPASPKPVPPPRVSPEPSEASTSSVEGKRYPEELFTTLLPSQTLHPKTKTYHQKKSLKKMKEEVVDRVEEPEPPESPTVSPVVVNNTTTISKDPSPLVNSPESQPVKKPRLTFYPIISKLVPQSNESQKEEDEELELYLKLLAKKLKSYKGLERRQIMHEIDAVFLRKPSTSTTPQFMMASFEHSASSLHSDAN